MNCADIHELSPLHHSGELDAGQLKAFDAHVAGCSKCDADLRDQWSNDARLRDAIVQSLGDAIAHYEQVVTLPIPDKLPMPLQVHRHEGEPCPRCGTTLKAVHFEDYVIAYCPDCQTDGRVLKDRRLSRLLR